jgi:isopentenyl-diphosphate delta-isomerase
MVENERVHVFAAELPAAAAGQAGAAGALPLDRFDPAEVQDLAWLSHGELRAAIAAAPATFTPWLRIYLDRWPELGLSPRRWTGAPGVSPTR